MGFGNLHSTRAVRDTAGFGQWHYRAVSVGIVPNADLTQDLHPR